VSSYRPPVPVIGVCDDPRVYRQLALVWGVQPLLCRFSGRPNYDEIMACARGTLLAQGIAHPGDRIVVTAGLPFFHVAGTTNMLRVEVL
jgi:pyruvate kinase